MIHMEKKFAHSEPPTLGISSAMILIQTSYCPLSQLMLNSSPRISSSVVEDEVPRDCSSLQGWQEGNYR